MNNGNYSYQRRSTARRTSWVFFAIILTIFIPDAILHYVVRLRTPASRIAWREKIALLVVFFLAAALLCFWLEYVSALVCKPKKLFDYRKVFANDSKVSAIHGSVVDWSDYSSEMAEFVKQYPHQDLSLDFPRFMSLDRDSVDNVYNIPVLNECILNLNMSLKADAWLKHYLNIHPGYDYQDDVLLHCPQPSRPNITGAPCFGGINAINGYKTKGVVFYDQLDVKSRFNSLPTSKNSTQKAFVILNGNVLDVATYLLGATDIVVMSSKYSSRSFVPERMFLPRDLTLYMYRNLGKDISSFFDNETFQNREEYRTCITQLFQAGVSYKPTTCSQINPGLWATMGIGLTYFLIKINLAHLVRIPFFQRLLFSSVSELRSSPVAKTQEWPHTILMVPCFAESSDTLKQTLDNLSRSAYDDTKKLLLFVCDGVAVNNEAKKETYKLLLESLGHSSYIGEPSARAYISLGQGTRQTNYAKVYSGYYETGRHRVPYLVIVKIGSPKERLQKHPAPYGNRGKRDSLVLVFGFLERCINLANKLITPLDYEIFSQCYNVLGIDPRHFKYLLLTDANVQIQSNAVHKLVLRLEHNCKMLAVSGHIRPANPEENMTTMIQIFPAYMDFFTGLAYESCLGSVTTISGGFVMFKIWTEKEDSTHRYKRQKIERLRSHSPKVSDEIIALSPFGDEYASTNRNTETNAPSKVIKKGAIKARPESNLSLVPNVSIQACCIHPTVIRGICTPQPNTMHMRNLLLLGEEKHLSTVLLTSHPGFQLGFEPDAEGYVILSSSFRSLQNLQTRNLRATFHALLEMYRVSWRLGFTYWIVSSFELIDRMFSIPITIYIYVIFVRSIRGLGMSYTIIACAFTALIAIHMLVFLIQRQFKYIIWFALYCLVSIPIFAVWFPLLALWQSDYISVWYNMQPITNTPFCKTNIHGIMEHRDMLDQNMIEDKDDDELGTQEVLRLTFSQFDVMEIQRLRQEAEAALDSNFIDFSSGNQNVSKQKAKQDRNRSEFSIYSPPTAQVRDGQHSTRLAPTFAHRRIPERRQNQLATTINPEFAMSDPFDDKHIAFNESSKSNRLAHNQHGPSDSQSSRDTFEIEDSSSQGFQDNVWISDPWGEKSANTTASENTVYNNQSFSDDHGSTVSVISHTFSIVNTDEFITDQLPIHRLDPTASRTEQTHTPEEGRRKAVHTNLKKMAIADVFQSNIPHINTQHSDYRIPYPTLNNKFSSHTLACQPTHESENTFDFRELQGIELSIFNDIKSHLQQADLDLLSMTQVKEYVTNRYKDRIDFSPELFSFIERCVTDLTCK
ncbi:chitin synthase-domain-containing protein [Sporodiniella umbellata]|nr:chitin synthase-domain-containing protein [Sporodiniella umbellata]